MNKYIERGFETLEEYFKKYNKKDGFLLLFGERDEIGKITAITDGEIATGLIKKYGNPILWNDEAVNELYKEMARRDCAIAFDRDGNLIDTGRFVRNVDIKYIPDETLEKIKKYKKRLGTRHLAAAYASTFDIDAMAASEEIGTIMAFSDGYIIKVYEPLESRIERIKNNCRMTRELLNAIF
ncbi:MAG: hypothetical protein QXP39_03005 [Candidatus Aenigmatarchaeota archaeon]